MDRQALGMAIFMGLYVPLFTGISVTIHRWMRQTPQQSNKIIIVHRQFENQSFDDVHSNPIFKLDKSHTFPFSKNILLVKSLHFYKLLPPAYIRDDNLLQNFDLNNIAIPQDELLTKVNRQKPSEQQDL